VNTLPEKLINVANAGAIVLAARPIGLLADGVWMIRSWVVGCFLLFGHKNSCSDSTHRHRRFGGRKILHDGYRLRTVMIRSVASRFLAARPIGLLADGVWMIRSWVVGCFLLFGHKNSCSDSTHRHRPFGGRKILRDGYRLRTVMIRSVASRCRGHRWRLVFDRMKSSWRSVTHRTYFPILGKGSRYRNSIWMF